MTYRPIEITSAGLTFDPTVYPGVLTNPQFYTSGTITLAANVVVNPTVVSGEAVSFSILWEASVLLSTFSVTICGQVINQSDVSTTGTFSCFYDGSSWSVQYTPNNIDQPQMNQSTTTVLVPAIGGTKTLVAGVDSDYVILSGIPTTLSSNYSVGASTTGVKDRSSFTIQISGGITLSGNTLTVFGQTIAAVDALNGGVAVQATFNANTGAWVSYVVNRTITTSLFPTISGLSVLGNATGSSASPTAIAAASDGSVLRRSGSTLVFDKLIADNFGSSLFPTQLTAVSISSSAILNSYTTPIKVLDAAGSGKICPIFKVFGKMTYSGTPYASNTNANIFSFSGTDKIMSSTGFWAFAASGIDQMFEYNPGASSNQYVANDNIMLATSGGNPTAGNGACTLYVLHSTISI